MYILPALVLLNSFEEIALKDTNMLLFSNGTIMWIPKARIYTLCFMEYDFFPFDIQVCTIRVGSWTYDESKVCAVLFGLFPTDKNKFRAW